MDTLYILQDNKYSSPHRALGAVARTLCVLVNNVLFFVALYVLHLTSRSVVQYWQ